MKSIIFTVVATLVVVVNATVESEFVVAYDAGKYEDAAKMISGLDSSRPEVARRLGVMYFTGKGVVEDQTKGRDLLEQAMMAGDATAAVNLVKIYYKIDKNFPKASWCLMVAEGSNDVSVKDDVVKLRSYLGDDYLKRVALYVAQLHDRLADGKTSLKNKTAETDRERENLMKQIVTCQDESKKKDEALARAREELKSAKDDLGKKLVIAEEKIDADKKKIDELEEKLIASVSDRSVLSKRIEELKKMSDNPEVEDARKDKAQEGESNNSVGDGFERGWNTFWCAPCNFVRVGFATKSVYDATSQSSNEARGFLASAISAPVILCCEVVPTVCDLGNGFLDMLTFGAYGNWLYSDGLTSKWWRRDDTHFFPWIDRDR